jgi:hypothetical protein
MKDPTDTDPRLKPTSPEAKRFVDFTKKLMSVPKKELDRKQIEYQKGKQAKPKHR